MDIIKLLSSRNLSSTQWIKHLNIDGKFYHQVNNRFIYLSTHNCTHCQSLVYYGDIGGVVGEDVTVINRYPNSNFNIEGIDNIGITSVPIAAVGDPADSQAGAFIILCSSINSMDRGRPFLPL